MALENSSSTTINGVNLTPSVWTNNSNGFIINPNKDSKEITVTKVENGYTVYGEGKTYVASSTKQLIALIEKLCGEVK